ncbi:hypothetical protein AA0Z99_08510 [Agrococcus sp. 1P02AA]|uniref:hypothetical protein n=1 Tax=Agrococcus sp. 1P02AA TaxID=3132259 RepID=UPI0039A5F9D2
MRSMVQAEGLSRADVLAGDRVSYARGFVVSDGEVLAPEHWSTLQLDSRWQLRWDPRVAIARAQHGASHIVVIGTPLHLDAPRESGSAIAARLLHALARSLDEFQDQVDALCGRFAVLRIDRDELRVQSDAAGLRTIAFSTRGAHVVGSHTRLVAECIGVQASALAYATYFRDNGMFQFPGRHTEYDGVLSLTPNTELSAVSRTTVRVFPRGPVVPCTIDEAAQAIIEAADAQVGWLRQRDRVVLSISAGVDSRSSLALLRGLTPNLELFTYDLTYAQKNAGNRFDREAGEALALLAGVDHQVVAVEDREPAGPLHKAMHSNSRAVHSRKLANAYVEQLPIDALHVRSHVHGVVKGHYQKFNYGHRGFDGGVLARIASADKAVDPKIADAFEAFRLETAFDQRFDYDPLDLLYWEYRGALIQAPALLESDLALDTHALLASRRLLARVLGLPVGDRKAASVFLRVIELRWPELLEVPLNGRDARAQGYR